MPHPLPEALTAVLQLDRTAALAAAFIIGTHHVDVLQWVTRTLCGDTPEPQPQRQKANARRGRGRKGDSHRKSRNNGDDPYLSRRRTQRDRDDEALLAALRSNPEGSISDWATTIGKSRTSCVSGCPASRACAARAAGEMDCAFIRLATGGRARLTCVSYELNLCENRR